MLTIFRRHEKNCPHHSEGREYRRCKCPISVEGLLGDEHVRRALKTRDWNRAQDIVREWESAQRITGHKAPVSIAQAVESFLSDMRARNLVDQTVKKYELLFSRLKTFASAGGYELLCDLDTDAMTQFRATWEYGPRSAQKMLERLRAFFRFCQARRWIVENPATHLKAPKVPILQTLPYTHEEMMTILAKSDLRRKETKRDDAKLTAIRLRSLILVMRYAGLRIGDAVSLSVDRLNGNTLFLYTAKTGTPVRVTLPAFVVDALHKTPPMNDRYWFRSVEAKLKTAVGKWQQRLHSLFESAKIDGGHAHRFRDTFAVELLLAGVPLERISVLLGHKSVRVTEKHYAPWVRARQEQLETDLQRAHASDPIVLMQNKLQDTNRESKRPN